MPTFKITHNVMHSPVTTLSHTLFQSYRLHLTLPYFEEKRRKNKKEKKVEQQTKWKIQEGNPHKTMVLMVH